MKEVSIKSFYIHGIEAVPVDIVVSCSPGIGIHLCGGLNDISVRECLLRTTTALQALGYKVPGQKIVIYIKDASEHQTIRTTAFDLPIAIGIILASGQLNAPDYDKYAIVGELGLDASVREVRSEYAMALAAEKIIIPAENSARLQNRPGIAGTDKVFLAANLDDALTILKGTATQFSLANRPAKDNGKSEQSSKEHFDLGKLVGNETAKRGLLIAAAGGHHIACMGPIGNNPSYLAACLAQILPSLTDEQYIETEKIHEAAWVNNGDCNTARPFQMSHRSSSMTSIFGGGEGVSMKPGAASLAHNGVLFLEEFEIFPKSVREGLATTLQEKKITISRLRDKVIFPADFQLMLSFLPCPCGYKDDGSQRCTCTPSQIERYRQQYEGPVFDKCDIHIWAQPLTFGPYTKPMSNADCREKVTAARRIQALRFTPDCGIRCNAEIPARLLEDYCPLSPECQETLSKLMESLSLPAKEYSGIVRVARTIADIAGSKDILKEHIVEAVSYKFISKR